MLRKSSVYARTQSHWHAIDSGILLCQYLVCWSQQINQFVRGYHSCRRRSFCSSLVVLSKVRPSWPFLSIQRPPPKYLSFFFSHGWSEIKQLSIMNKVWPKIVVVVNVKGRQESTPFQLPTKDQYWDLCLAKTFSRFLTASWTEKKSRFS